MARNETLDATTTKLLKLITAMVTEVMNMKLQWQLNSTVPKQKY